jgi:hypothetical protein
MRSTTKYTYDDKTFRLTRLWTFRNGGTENLQDLNYMYDPVGNITQIIDNAQQDVFFNGQHTTPSQKFEYDALYRLIKSGERGCVNFIIWETDIMFTIFLTLGNLCKKRYYIMLVVKQHLRYCEF